jgi:Ca-activated chloride channel family protein
VAQGGYLSFVYWKYLPIVIILAIVISLINYRFEKKYFKWIETYWFFKRKRKSIISTIFFSTSIIIFSLALCDLRGPEEIVRTEISDQKTIIIIDSSSSMLVEDVRPNRYKKSLMMARHFIKNAVGHQIAVVLFSDVQKRLVPFTDDIDLLDSRVAGLEDLDISRSGSNIVQAIKESIQYFVEVGTDKKDLTGNILLLTDSEDHNEYNQLEIPKGVSLAVVGVGTLKGGKIPIRSSRGTFRGYKKKNGEEIISKFNEDLLKKIGSKVDSFKYWVALSYSLPTDEILSFFRNIHQKGNSKANFRVRKVYSQYLVITAIILLIISYLLKMGNSLYPPLIFILAFGSIQKNSFSQESPEENKEKKSLSPELELKKNKLFELHKNGNLKKDGVLNLAQLYSQEGNSDSALTLYEENLSDEKNEKPIDIFNYGTTLLKKKNYKDGIHKLRDLKERLNPEGENEKKLIEEINKNIAFALQKQKQDKKKDKEKKDKKKKEDKDKKKNDKDGQGEKKDEKEGKGSDKEQKGKKDPKDGSEKKDENKNKEEKNENNKKDKNDSEKEKSRPQSVKEREDEIRRKRKMVKIPAMLKQLLSDDSELQKKKVETKSTRENKTIEKKDW